MILMPLFICYFVSLALFLWMPEFFYKRAWEYFRDVAYYQPEKRVWHGYEQGDYSRSLIACFADDRRETTVSCDDQGFRSTALSCEHYPILVVGDCNIWGANLSDDETIPWRLATSLNIPVFNGGRTPGASHPYLLESLLNHRAVKDSKIIIEFARDEVIDKELFKRPFALETYQAFVKEPSSLIMTTPIKRYFLLSKLMLHCQWLYSCWTATWDANGLEKQLHFSRSPEDLTFIVKNIRQRAKALKNLGYRYIFIPLPSRPFVMTKSIIGNPALHNKILVETLIENGVESLDLCPDMIDCTDLFIKKDNHLGPVGTSLITERIVSYLS